MNTTEAGAGWDRGWGWYMLPHKLYFLINVYTMLYNCKTELVLAVRVVEYNIVACCHSLSFHPSTILS